MNMTNTDTLIFGLHSVQAALEKNAESISELYLLKDRNDKRLQKIRQLAEKHNIPLQIVERQQLDQYASGNHQGVVARLSNNSDNSAQVYDEAFLKSRLARWLDEGQVPFLLILDGVTDPHNLGACLRSAEAAGVQCVIVPKDNAATLNPTTIKVACGAADTLPLVRVTNLARTMQWLQEQGVWIAGAAGEAEQHHYQLDLKGPLAIAMGSEGSGLRRLTREHCDYLMRIPMMGSVSSLNVSVATGVCLFEALRQRQ